MSLIDEIQQAQMLAGEQAVVRHLEKLGLAQPSVKLVDSPNIHVHCIGDAGIHASLSPFPDGSIEYVPLETALALLHESDKLSNAIFPLVEKLIKLPRSPSEYELTQWEQAEIIETFREYTAKRTRKDPWP